MKKRILSVLLTACLALSLWPTTALAEDYNISATTESNAAITLEINGDYNETDNTIGSDTAYSGNTLVAAVSAAGGASAIKQLKITEGTVTAADWAYIRGLTALEHFEIAEGVTVAAVPDTTSAKPIFLSTILSVNIPQAIPIGAYAFYGCVNLTTVSLPKATAIGEFAFRNCALTAISLPEATAIGGNVFNGCKNLTTAELPGAETIPGFVFYNCSKLTTVSLPKATSIGQMAFGNCTALSEISLPEATEINDSAFYTCSNLTTLSLPQATSIGALICYECSNLTTVSLPRATSIGRYDFYNCSKLATVSLPQVTSIGEYAFSGCTALATLKLGATPPTLGTFAFEHVLQTNPLVLLDASGTPLTDIALTTAQTAYKAANGHALNGRWYGWTVIADVITFEINGTYNETDNSIGSGTAYSGSTLCDAISAAGGASSIKQLKITAGTMTEDDWKYLNNMGALEHFEIADGVTVASMPDTTVTHQALPLTILSVNIPQTIAIGNCSFAGCEKLMTVNMPNATSIGEYAFTDCKKLSTVNLPNATLVGYYAFSFCTDLTEISLPKVTTIGALAFANCINLTTVDMPEVTEIKDSAFWVCQNLTTMSLPKVTTVGMQSFGSCINLTTVSLPQVTSIGASAFWACPKLTTVSLPKAMSIGTYAFSGCTAFATLKLGATPPTLGTSVFYNVPQTNPLVLLETSGTPLTDGALTSAQAAYKAVDDQDTSDNLWYGWKITGGSTPPEDLTHKHCLCGGTNNVGDHTSHTSVVFKEWNTNNAMPTEAGNYYLNTDVTLSSQWVVNADIGLCLNGHTIKLTGKGSAIWVKDGNTLNLSECNNPASSGAITGGVGTGAVGQSATAGSDDEGGSGVYVSSNGTFNMYGGKINGNTANYEGGGVHNDGNFTMYGGSITGNTAIGAGGTGNIALGGYGGGVYNEGTFTIYDGTISKNNSLCYGGGVYNKKTFTMSGGIISINQTGSTSSTNKGGGGIANFGTFTMNNGEISSNQASIEGGGVYNKGTFNMENGKIVTNTVNGDKLFGDSFGGGVANLGPFTMNGGEIRSNQAIGGTSSNATNNAVGGGVYNKGTFVMGETGSIISNTASSSKAAQGGGMYNQGSLTVNGGKITSNSVTGNLYSAGGGVYDQSGWSYIAGAPVIINNAANNIKSNWLIFYTNPFQFAEPLTAGASIGVSMGYSISDDYSGVLTSGYNSQNRNADPAIYFSSDNPNYHVELIKNEAKLVVGPAPVVLKIIISNLKTAKVGSPYSQEILTSYNGTGTKTYTATGLPSGLSINASSGMITGTPAAASDTGSPYSVTIKVSDGTLSDTKTFSMTVDVSDANKTYTVTFNENGGNGTMSVQSFNAATPQNLTLNAFTRSGYTFIGWNTTKEGTGDSYNDGASYTAATNATLYAQWKEITYTVSGTVKDKDDKKVSGAEVKLMKGNLQIGATVTTDENGNFSISNVPNGTYNLVANKDGITVTSMITVSNADMTLKSAIILPSGKTNSVLVVRPNTPQIVVGNLDGQFLKNATDNDKGVIDDDQTVVQNGGAVEIKLTVEKKEENVAPKASDIRATAKQEGKTVGIFIDFSLVKTVTPSGGDSTPTTLTQLQDLIDVLIPLDTELQDKDGYVVYRYHGNAVDTISTNQNQDGEKIELIDGGKTIKLTIKKFSTYAIGYTASSDPNNGGGSSGGNSGGGSHSNATKDNSNTGLPYYIKSGNKIYLGYSSPVSGTMKYIAPKGEVILFKENQKNFIDVSGHWAKDNIDFVTERELFIGTAPNVFSPDESMTRAMFATVIGRLHERSFGEISQSDEKPFADISYDSYYTKYVIWAEENGIVKGIGGGKFDPQRAITRQEMAMLVNNYLTFAKFNIPVTQQAILFDDESKIADWAKPATQTVQKLGIIEGIGQNLFDPQRVSTRAQVSAVLQRMISEVISNTSN